MNILKNRPGRVLASVISTLIIYGVIWAVNSWGAGAEINRIVEMLGGRLPPGVIQAATFLLFVFGILEVFRLNSRITDEQAAYSLNLLPEKENWVLSADDVNKLKLQVQDIERSGKYYLTSLVRKCCTKYRLSRESSEALALADSQIDIYRAEMESEQSFIRYTLWAIPSVGFIGTVWGIGESLGLAHEASSREGIKKITQALGVAFDTTLWALVLCIILMYAVHCFQKRVDDFFIGMKDYVIENLINRLYK